MSAFVARPSWLADAPDESPINVDADLLGPLAQYAVGATDLFVNGAGGLWVDRGAGPVRESGWVADESSVRSLAVSLIAAGGRHLDDVSPAVDVRLGDGIRVHAVVPPIATTGTSISIRMPRSRPWRLDDLVRAGSVNAAQSEQLREIVLGRRNVLVSGAAGAGKTTLLAALLGEVPTGERIVVLEDVAELRIAHPHVVALETRQPNVEGVGRTSLDQLVREALRMRPDRIAIGECRGPELRELLAALNTGHSGSAGTVHANSLADVPARLEALGAAAGIAPASLARQAAAAFDVVVHVERAGTGRRIAAIGDLTLAGDRLAVSE
ncbi:MAG TPA: TadA family conjugal transfer-associated ATPase [Candidatus Lumbricidophila sp.]|nr:TadA family conjugal transfer-associated ATPase [Candidatus Lumbricidophila sp.]